MENDTFTGRYPHMVHEYYVRRLRSKAARRRERIAALRTRSQAEAYVKGVRAAVRKCFSPFPKRTPLNPRVTGRDEYPRYVLEKVVFESRPGFLVTGNLYLPKGRAGPAALRSSSLRSTSRPAVLGLCGHSAEGKACDLYQSFCQGLVIKGFVVFVIDPISQGERRQFYPGDGGPRPGLCPAHNLMGNQMALVGGFFGTWRVWDAIRGLDYLLSRPEVDSEAVGATGNSGGGTLTTYLTALDPRLLMAAPSCFVTSYLANVENELPSDSEQNPPGILAAGLDQADLLLCYAPRPTMMLSQHDDFFDERSTRQAFEDVRKVHALLGGRDSAAYFVGKAAHGYHLPAREAMYGFFLRQAGMAGSAKEKGVALVEEARLYATPRGETRSRRVFEFTAETAKALAKRRGRPAAARVIAGARKLLALPAASGPPHYRALRGAGGTDSRGHRFIQFAVETEPGIQAIVTSYEPDTLMHPPTGRVLLYVGHVSSQDDCCRLGGLSPLLMLGQGRTKSALVAVDPRGMGQSAARTCGSPEFFAPYGSDFLYASTGEMLGESYLGRRVHDVMRTMDFLLADFVRPCRNIKSGLRPPRVDLLGRGLGSILVAFAALLHPSRPRARIWHYLPSFHLLTQAPHYAWPLSSILRGVLTEFDLPDVYRALGARLTRSRPWGPMMKAARDGNHPLR